MEHILIPVDGSDTSFRAIDEGAIFAEKFGAKVTLMYVLAHPEGEMMTAGSSLMRNAIEADKEEGLTMLKEQRARVFKDNPDICDLVVDVGPVANVVADYIEKNGCDFVIMGTQGMGSALKRFLVGSVTKKLLTMVDIPVLVVR